MKRVCLMTTAAASLYSFHKGRYAYFGDHGFELIGLAGPDEVTHKRIRDEWGMKTIVAPLEREIFLAKDIWCLLWLWWHFLWNRYDIIHIGTPKAMLLGSLAACLAGHRNVMITHHGRVYENYSGLKRRIFNCIERLTAFCARWCCPVAEELKDNLVDEGLYPERIMRFIPPGSCNGFDASVFEKNEKWISQGRGIRADLGIDQNDLVILFVGRIRLDKGVCELVEAFEEGRWPDTHLVLVGDREPVSPLTETAEKSLEENSCIHILPAMHQIQPAYAMADVFVLPSHREGFPLVPMEAAAMELPVVGSSISGTREAILDGQTGLLFPMGDSEALRDRLSRLIDSAELRGSMAQAGRERVVSEFRPEVIWNGILTIYRESTED